MPPTKIGSKSKKPPFTSQGALPTLPLGLALPRAARVRKGNSLRDDGDSKILEVRLSSTTCPSKRWAIRGWFYRQSSRFQAMDYA